MPFGNNRTTASLIGVEPFEIFPETVIYGRDYVLNFGYDSDYATGGTVALFFSDEETDVEITSLDFASSDYYDYQYGAYVYGATLDFAAYFFLLPGDYSLYTVAELDDDRTLESRSAEFYFDYEKVDLGFTSITIADPVVLADGDAWFALNIENSGVLSHATDYTVEAFLRPANSTEPFSDFGPVTSVNVAAESSEREIVRLRLGDLDTDLDPGTYEVRFSVLPQDPINEPDWDISDNYASQYIFIKPENPETLARERGDLDGDRIEDVLFYNADTRGVGQFGMPTGEWSSLGRAGVGWVAKGTGHFDSDDDAADVLWFNENTRNVGRFDVSETGLSWGGLGKAGVGWDVAGAGDFNGDGTDDILWLNTLTNTVGQFRVSQGTTSWNGIGKSGSVWDFSGVGDFNGDGVDDVLWYNTQTGALGQFQMHQDGMSWAQITTLGQGFRVESLGDLDGDGTDDIIVYKESSREVGLFSMNDGIAAWQGLAQDALVSGWSIEGTGDFDGDGRDDVMMRHEDGRIGRYLVEDQVYTFVEIGSAGSDWDIIL